MPYADGSLRLIEYGPRVSNIANRVHMYSTADAASVVEAANYFNSATRFLLKGDIIMALMATGGTPVFKQYVVTSATGAATVTVALQSTTAG